MRSPPARRGGTSGVVVVPAATAVPELVVVPVAPAATGLVATGWSLTPGIGVGAAFGAEVTRSPVSELLGIWVVGVVRMQYLIVANQLRMSSES